MSEVLFSADQIVSASEAAKRFGELKKKAATKPQFVLSGGKVEIVIVNFDHYEAQCKRLQELEQQVEEKLLEQRIERLEKAPSCAVSWKSIRRSKL